MLELEVKELLARHKAELQERTSKITQVCPLNHLEFLSIRSMRLCNDKLKALFLISVQLEIEYAMQFTIGFALPLHRIPLSQLITQLEAMFFASAMLQIESVVHFFGISLLLLMIRAS